LGGRKGIRPVKNWGAGVVTCLEQGANLHMAQLMPLPLTVSCFSKIQIGFTFLVLAHLDSLGKGPLNVCVYLCPVFKMAGYCCFHSKRRKRRGLPVAGEKAPKDGKKTQASGRVGETNSKDRTAAAAAGGGGKQPADVKKAHEADGFKSTATLDVRADVAQPEQTDSDDRLCTRTFHIVDTARVVCAAGSTSVHLSVCPSVRQSTAAYSRCAAEHPTTDPSAGFFF